MSERSTVAGPGGEGAARRPKICLLALSDIPNDPRVRRQGDAFHAAGWEVVGVGLPPGRAAPETPWPVVHRDRPGVTEGDAPDSTVAAENAGVSAGLPAPRRSLRQRIVTRLEPYPPLLRAAHLAMDVVRPLLPLISRALLAVRMLRIRVQPDVALDLYWSWTNIREIYDVARRHQADVWLANDWNMLPVAARLMSEHGGRLAYDSHEFATEEYASRLTWRIFHRPLVRAVEGRFIGEAGWVSTVSQGIADRLHDAYRLPERPLLIRNVPRFEEAAFRPTGESIRVLYHGIVSPVRALDELVDSVAAWRPELSLTIRGPGDPAYLESLVQRIRERGLEDRVQLAPPVAMTELVAAAVDFDIGIFVLPGDSQHNVYALPNKFFEYLMAGLALCVSDLPEMSHLVDEHDVGVRISQPSPQRIAEAVNALDRAEVDGYKRNALVAARSLCWEEESQRMLAATLRLLGDERGH